MSETEIIDATFKALTKRTDECMEAICSVDKRQAKTATGMNDLVDLVREMREKVRNLMNLQDDITHQFKSVDRILMGGDPNTFIDTDYKKPERKKKEIVVEDDYSFSSKSKYDEIETEKSSKVTFDDEEPAKPRKEVVFDELSDEEPAAPAAPAEEPAEEVDAEREAALAEAKKLEEEFEKDEAALADGEAPIEANVEPTVCSEPPPAEGGDPEPAITDAAGEAGAAVDEEEEARKIAEMELKALEEEEARLAEEELLRLEEEEKRLQEEEELARVAAEEEELKRLQEEEEALRAEEEELRRLEEEEALAKAEEEAAAKKAAEEEAAKKAAEEEAKKKTPPKAKPGKVQFGNLKSAGGGKNKFQFK